MSRLGLANEMVFSVALGLMTSQVEVLLVKVKLLIKLSPVNPILSSK